MKKLLGILKLNNYPKGDFGIEIEVEGRNLREVDNEFWNTVRDGSLRGESFEYVLKQPIAYKLVQHALQSLSSELSRSTLNFSFRTSVHVHMNVLDLTMVQVLNAMYTYLLLEEPLMTFCGRERKGNRFCLRLSDAEDILGYYNILFKGNEKDLMVIDQERIRYASMNIAALIKYGSLEFRGMKGTLDTQMLLDWVTFFQYIKEYAMRMDSPVDIHEEYAELGATEFARRVFRDKFDRVMYPRLERDIQKSFSLTLDLPYIFHQHYSAKKEEAVPKAPKRAINMAADVGLAEGTFETVTTGVPVDAEVNIQNTVTAAQRAADRERRRREAIANADPRELERLQNATTRAGLSPVQAFRYVADNLIAQENRRNGINTQAIPQPPRVETQRENPFARFETQFFNTNTLRNRNNTF